MPRASTASPTRGTRRSRSSSTGFARRRWFSPPRPTPPQGEPREGHQPRQAERLLRRNECGERGQNALFGAVAGTHGNELWKSDGTAAGTRLVKDIDPEPNASGLWV